MVDLLDSSGVVWKIQLSGSPATPISIELDGEQMELIGVSSSADSRPNRMIIQDNGVEKVVFCAKVDSKWWLHHDGAVSVFEVVEPGASSSNNNEGELARCETAGILGTAAGLAGLLSAQKTINFLMKFNQNSNFLTLINCKSLSFNNIKIDKNPRCNLILSKI